MGRGRAGPEFCREVQPPEAAQSVMGELPAAIVVAAILQRGAAITSAGGYLRELTRKAEVGEFTLGPMLMALIGGRKREKKRA